MNPRNNFRRSFGLLLAVAFIALVAANAPARSASPASDAQGDQATIAYRKVFKSSYPEFTEIKVSQSGAATYDIRQMSDTPAPQAAQISAPLVTRIFELAAEVREDALAGIPEPDRKLLLEMLIEMKSNLIERAEIEACAPHEE